MPIALIPLILEFSLKFGIPAARQIVEMIRKPEPTVDDWDKVFDLAESNAKKFLEETKAI